MREKEILATFQIKSQSRLKLQCSIYKNEKFVILKTELFKRISQSSNFRYII